jgi:hypothetical protein
MLLSCTIFLVLPHLGFLASARHFCLKEIEFVPLAERFNMGRGENKEILKCKKCI